MDRDFAAGIPDSEDGDLVFPAGEVGEMPGEVEWGALPAVAEVINPRPPDLLALWGSGEDEAGRWLPKLSRVPHSSQTIAVGLCQALLFIGSRSVVNVGILCEPLSWIF